MYRIVDAALLRAAALPLRPEQSDPPPAAIDTPQAAAQAVRWLRTLWLPDTPAGEDAQSGAGVRGDRDVLVAAIEVANPELAARARAVTAGAGISPRELRRLVLAVRRYEVRARGRATPFGLFAGIGPARIGPTTHLIRGPGRARARVDAEWLAAVITRLEHSPGLRPYLSVRATNLAFLRDGRLVLPYPGMHTTPDASTPGSGAAAPDVTGSGVAVRGRAVDGSGGPGAELCPPAEVSVRHSAPVATLMRAAGQRALPISEAIHLLATAHPGTPRVRVEALVASLIAQGFLITCLRAPHTDTDPLGHALAALRAVHPDTAPEIAGVLRELRATGATLRRHDQSGPAAQGAARTHARTRMQRLTGSARAVSVDLHSGSSVVVPEHVAREAEAAAAVLVRLNPHPSGPACWQDFHARFLEHYGVGAVVPLAELLFGGTGLGFPAGFRGSRLPPLRAPALGERDTRLLAVAQRAAWEHHHEIVLDETVLGELAVGSPNAVAPHTELTAHLLATSTAELDRGDFHLAVTGVSRAAGTVCGRFLDLLDPADRDRMRAAYRALPAAYPDAVSVQLSAAALAPRAENITRSPTVLPTVVRLGEHAPHDVPGIELHDLAVTADATHLLLVSLATGRPVHPVAFSAVEYHHAAHPLTRFLGEIGTARAAACAPFTWGPAATALPYLPRVRHGRSILSAARWLLPADTLPDPTTGFAQWRAEFTRWQRHAEIPDTVTVGEHDRRLRLHLDDDADLHLLRDTLTRDGQATVREAPADAQFGWYGHVHELVLPLAATPTTASRQTRRRPAPRPAASRGTPPEAYPPGDPAWYYLKVYAHPQQQGCLLGQHLPRLLAPATRAEGVNDGGDGGTEPAWWFLRYEDPDPHLRIRIRPTPTVPVAGLLARIAAWSTELRARGLISRTQLETYLPETGRFGHGAAIRAAENVFITDSTAVLAQLATTTPATTQTDGVHPHAITAASVLDLTAAFTGDTTSGARWLRTHVPRSGTHPLGRDARRDALRLTTTGSSPTSPHLPGVVRAAWARRRTALAAYRAHLDPASGPRPDDVLSDLIHLHCVRVHGLDPATEHTCTHLARAAALSHLARTRPAP